MIYKNAVEVAFALGNGTLDAPRILMAVLSANPDAVLDAANAGKNTAAYNAVEAFADEYPSVWAFLKEGRVVDAIRRMREITGLGLKEAKDKVDAIRDVGSQAGFFLKEAGLYNSYRYNSNAPF